MAGAFGREQVLDDRDGMRRGHADRLVEHDPAVHVAFLAFLWSIGPGLAIRACGNRRRERPSLVLLAAQVALDLRRSQKLLDPFRFLESLVDAKANLGRKFQVNALRDFAAHVALVALQRIEHLLTSRPPSGMM